MEMKTLIFGNEKGKGYSRFTYSTYGRCQCIYLDSMVMRSIDTTILLDRFIGAVNIGLQYTLHEFAYYDHGRREIWHENDKTIGNNLFHDIYVTDVVLDTTKADSQHWRVYASRENGIIKIAVSVKQKCIVKELSYWKYYSPASFRFQQSLSKNKNKN